MRAQAQANGSAAADRGFKGRYSDGGICGNGNAAKRTRLSETPLPLPAPPAGTPPFVTHAQVSQVWHTACIIVLGSPMQYT